MYINDLNNVSNEIFSILFADDTSVFIEGNNIESAIEILNSELEKNIDMANRKQTNFKCFEITFHDFPSC